jgi:hypothetical protein
MYPDLNFDFERRIRAGQVGIVEPRGNHLAQPMEEERGRIAVDTDQFRSGTRWRAGHEMLQQSTV